MFLINDVKVLIISLLRVVLSPYAIDNIPYRGLFSKQKISHKEQNLNFEGF